MDETIKEMEYREDKIEAVKTDSEDDVIGQNLSKHRCTRGTNKIK